MSKDTIALLLPSPTQLGPWGDPGWLPAGQIHYVAKGPDFLWGGSAQVGDESRPSSTFDGMALRESDSERAEDVAAMTLGMLDVPGWRDLESWWDGVGNRGELRRELVDLCERNRGRFKIGIVRFTDDRDAIDRLAAIASGLEQLGIGTTFFVAAA